MTTAPEQPDPVEAFDTWVRSEANDTYGPAGTGSNVEQPPAGDPSFGAPGGYVPLFGSTDHDAMFDRHLRDTADEMRSARRIRG